VEKATGIAESYDAGRDRSGVSRGITSNVAAAVHLAAAGQADRPVCAGHTHPGSGTGGAGGCVTA